MAILRLLASLGLDKSAFDAGIAAANKQVASLGSGFKSQLAGAFGAAAILSFTKSIVDMGSEIQDMSDWLGISVEDVQRFSMAAKLGGQGIDVVSKAIDKLRIAMGEGDNPLAMFGVSDELMKSENVVAVFEQIAQSLEGTGLNAERTAALFDTFGKSASRLVPILLELKDADKGTLFFSAEDVSNIDKADDFFSKVWNTLKVVGAKTSTPLLVASLFGDKASSGPIVAPPGMSEEDKLAKKDQLAREKHMREQDRALALEQFEREQEAEEHRRQQDILLANEKADELAEFEKRMRGGSGIGMGGGGIPGVLVGGIASSSVPSQLQKVNENLNRLERAMTQRGILIRDKVN